MISDEEKDQVRAASDLVAIVQETVELKPAAMSFGAAARFMAKRPHHFTLSLLRRCGTALAAARAATSSPIS